MSSFKSFWIMSAALISILLLPSSVVNADEGPIGEWTELSATDARPRTQRPFISSDGSCVAYQEYAPGSGESQRILVLNRLSGKTRQLPFDHSSDVVLIGLSPDCSQVVLQNEQGDDGQVYYLSTKNPIGLPQRTTILRGAKNVSGVVLSGDGNVILYRNPLGDGLLLQRLAPGADPPIRVVKHDNVSPTPVLLSEQGDVLAFITTAKIYGGAPQVPGTTGHNGGDNTVFVTLHNGQASEYLTNRTHVKAGQCDDILPIGFAPDLTAAVKVWPQRCHTCKPPAGKLCYGAAGLPFSSASFISPKLGTTKQAFYVKGMTTNSPDEEKPWYLAVVPGTEKLIVAFLSRSGACVRLVENMMAKPECLVKTPPGGIPHSAVVSKDGRWMAFIVENELRMLQLAVH